MTIRGYARVSTADQDLGIQLEALKAAGAEDIYQEKISGKNADRPELKRIMAAIKPGDVLLVTRLDRLARSTLDLLSILKTVGDSGGAFRSIADTWADTTTPHGRLMLTVLGGLAEFERELIKARTGEGIKRAKAAGVRFGRPPRMTDKQREDILTMLRCGYKPSYVAEQFQFDSSTIRRLRLKAA